ncbi:hypothetical protein EJ06DRAFT_549541 [Trichodelitschia bisporula]|uniref:Peptidase S1 domain-containing protein n=1 Tax=Trichodelitschia bisporula TaxID=703511 RepID=A0A6G1HUK9_9PEZI|nr:hypothetical protein EJ06DRAFT_549541 [Trichodelitschia bisporula]
MTPVRIATESFYNDKGEKVQPDSPTVVLIGVPPDSLTHETGIEVAVACRNILIENSLYAVHVEIKGSTPTLSASLYRPLPRSYLLHRSMAPFTTCVGLSICSANMTYCKGTAGFYFVDSTKPGKLFLLTARHLLFSPDEEKNELYVYEGSAPQRKVMLLGQHAFDESVKAVKRELSYLETRLSELEEIETTEWLASLSETDRGYEIAAIEAEKKRVNRAIPALKKLLDEVLRDWEKEQNCVIGHVVLSPPISFNVDSSGYTEDWAIAEVHDTMISEAKFVGNVIQLGSVGRDDLVSWMCPSDTSPLPFKYPYTDLLRISKKSLTTTCSVLLRASGLTVGRLNNVRSVNRYHFQGQPTALSREIAVLSRGQWSSFSARGDSGSIVVDGVGGVCGVLTGGEGCDGRLGVTFVTSINFLFKRLENNGYNANIFITADDL